MSEKSRKGATLMLKVYGRHDPLAFFMALAGSDGMATAQALGTAIIEPGAGGHDLCAACGGPLDHPPDMIGIMRGAGPNRATVMALKCCTACAAEGPEPVLRKLSAFLCEAFPGLRSGEATHTGPDALQ